jgi:prepilin peptidase CpaA
MHYRPCFPPPKNHRALDFMNVSLEARDVAVVVGAAACWFDLRTRRIPNLLTFGAALAGVAYSTFAHGAAGLLMSVGGWLLGCALFLPFFMLGGMGAGDVKLIAAIGAWLGPISVFWVALYAMIAGGVMAVGLALATGYLRQALSNLSLLLMHWRVVGIRPLSEITLAHSRGPRLPYALPITAGTVVALWLR